MQYKNLKKVIKETAPKGLDYCWEYRGTILQAAFLAVHIPAVGECSAAKNIQITPLSKPMEYIVDAFTGPIPISFTLLSGAVGGIAWGMGWDQQIWQRAIKCVGGGAIATSVGAGMDWIGIEGVTSCLFF